MAEKPTPPDGNILVYVEEHGGGAGEAAVRKYGPAARVYEGRRCEAESTSSGGEAVRQQGIIAPPYGWKRIIANGIVIYISPSNTALSSTEQVKAYLLAEGTCKCGLECPVNCETTFNFNPKVLTRPWTAPVIGPSDLTKLCNHKRKLLAQTSIDSLDNKYDGFRKKKRKFIPSLPPGLMPQVEEEIKEQEKPSHNGLPWRSNSSQEFIQESYSNGYQQRYELSPGNSQYKDGESRGVSSPSSFPSNPSNQNQVTYDQRAKVHSNSYESKVKRMEYSQSLETQQSTIVPSVLPTNLNVNRTPPWQQNKINSNNTYERVPPLHPHTVAASAWNNDLKKKQTKFIQRKRYPEESPNSSSSTPEPPSFLEDPSGYLAQQTALLNSTISRQSGPTADGIPLSSNVNNRFIARSKCNKTIITSRYPDSSLERRKSEEPSSTLSDKNIDERGPIQGTTVSTSNRSPVEIRPPENIVTTMASGHTQSSNTITSVLAGKANTATVSVNNQGMHQKNQQSEEISLQQDDIRQILVPSPGQIVVANSMLPNQSKSVINQPTVLLPGPLVLQPTSMVVDGLNTTVQIPQIVGNVVQNQVIDDSLLSPDSKRKANLKKRKLSPGGSMLLSPGSNNVMVQQQPINTPMLQALTILPSKTSFAGTQQLITTNMLQPLNLVQNFPIQQFIVPAGVGSMVMSDGTILQDTVQLNLLTPVQNTGVFGSSGQNLLTPGMVIRTPNSQSNKVMQNNQFLSSPNHYVVNNTFGGPVSPMLNVSPTQCNRNQDFLQQNLVVQQPSSSSSTIVQQNTTIVQQTTMVSNHQTQPTHTLNLNQNFILNDKPNFILTSEKQNFILSPNSGDKILISPDNMRGNFVLGNLEKQNFLINSAEKQNLIINNFDKNYLVDKKNSVSTQTQVASPGLYRESPPDTTTLSPVDQEVTTSLQPTSPESLPMVHCVSSSSHHDDQPFSVENYMGQLGKPSSYSDSSCLTVQTSHNKEGDYRRKMSLIEVPDNTNLPDGETVSSS